MAEGIHERLSKPVQVEPLGFEDAGFERGHAMRMNRPRHFGRALMNLLGIEDPDRRGP